MTPAGSSPQLQPTAIAPWVIPVLVGVTAVLGQVVLMRELMLLFSGNELSMGIMLASWLLWTATGSTITGLFADRLRSPHLAVALAQILCGLTLPFTVWVLRSARVFLHTVPGEALGPVTVLLISLLCLSIFCAASGSAFVLAVRHYQKQMHVSGRLATSTSYLLETAGSGLAGIVTSILLLRIFGSFQISLLVSLSNLCVAACLLLQTNLRRSLAIACATLLLALPLLVRIAPLLEVSSQQRIWPGFRILGSHDSIYGKLTIVDSGSMHSIYDNGSLIANVPDIASAEESVHYALMEHPAPRHVLLIGGGINGSIVEALKHPTVESIDYAELDPSLITVYQRFFPVQAFRAFADPRVHVHLMDGRLFVKQSPRRYDVIIVNLPNPQTAMLNRLYTVEFFQSTRERLTPAGLLALQLTASEDYISPRLADFLRCIHGTLRAVFPYIAVIPGGSLHIFASTQPGTLSEDPQLLITRLQQRMLQTQYVREYFIPFRMTPDRMAQIHDLLQPLPGTPTNRDFTPVAYYFSTVLWSTQFKSAYTLLLIRGSEISFTPMLSLILALSLFLALPASQRIIHTGHVRSTGLWSVFATGYTLMTLQLLILLSFQSVYGYVYSQLAVLIGMCMAGIAFGTWLSVARRRAQPPKSLLRRAAFIQILLALAAPVLLLCVAALAQTSGTQASGWIAQIAFPLLAFLCALPGGYQFPIATEIYLGQDIARTGAGLLYALDLLGGCVGALLISGFFIPLFGFWKTAWLATIVGITPALLLALASLCAHASVTDAPQADAHQIQPQ